MLVPGLRKGRAFHRVVELLPAQTAQDPWGLPQRRCDSQDPLPGDQPGGEEVDDADPRLESRDQSVRHPVRRQGAGMNISYTVNLTPPDIYSFIEHLRPKALSQLKNW